MDDAVRQRVRRRARLCCEYCRLPQTAAPYFTFHIEHIRAKQHGGGEDLLNLALACPDCNRYKGPNLTSVDPETNQVAPLFNPRLHSWTEHFAWDGDIIVGRTPTGRATIRLLNMNDPARVEIRAELRASGQL